MSLLRWLCVLACVGALGTLGACGDDSSSDADGGGDGDGDGDGDQTPGPIAEMITAEEGGAIETTGAGIDIPGGALSEDTEITVEVILPNGLPEEDSLGSLVYEFGPDGTQFEEPVELTIELNADVPEGMDAAIAWLDESTDTWTKLADSRIEGETVVATTDHFTKFAIVITAGGQTSGACTDFADFEACGGDVEGTWEFALACADVTAESLFGEDNPFEMCPDLGVSFVIDISGTITFEGSGDYMSSVTRSGEFGLNIPTTCLDQIGGSCAMFADPEDMTTATEVDGVCEVVTAQDESTSTEMGTYELEGSTVIMTDSATSEEDPPAEYCVQGDVITVRIVDVDEETMQETVTYMQATRQ